jgi:prepilin-type processing-associated H-X9-DG protein
MNCAECKELLVAYIEGLLDETEKRSVTQHLKDCAACRAELEEINNLRRRLIQNGKTLAHSDLEDKVLDRIVREQNVRLKATDKAGIALKISKIIVKSPITKLAAAAVIIIAVLIGINQFGGTVENTAFADVVKNIQSARTLTYRSVFTTENQESQFVKTMVLEPYLMRVELADGRIWILDHGQGRTLLLDSENKQAILSSTSQQTLDLYDTFRDFRNKTDFSVQEIGQREIDGMKVIGFQLTNGENVIIIWSNPQTFLPIRVEQTAKDKDGKVVKIVTTNITFDTELDESLFSFEAPEGYRHISVDGPAERSVKFEKRSQTLSNMRQILQSCLLYAQDHQDQWPDSLQDLAQYGLSKNILVNWKQPEREIGYVYLRPSTPISPQQVVLYEVYDSWGDGINVGFADGHVQFIEKESNFINQLKEVERK